MPQHVFTYGSLMFAPVWQRVVTGSYRGESAELAGFRRFAIVDETYPGIVEAGAEVDAEAGMVAGVLYFDVNDTDLQALDAFEGSDYQRRTVQVTTSAGTLVTAQTYVFLSPQRLARHDWDPAAFALARFMATYCHDRLGDAAHPAPDEPV